MAEWQTKVLNVTLRIVGPVKVRVITVSTDLNDVQASAMIGNVLCRVYSRQTAQHIRQCWQHASHLAERLPERINPAWLGSSPNPYANVAAVIGLGGKPVATAAYIPVNTTLRAPQHLRMVVGPVVWEVCDQEAFTSIARGWRVIEKRLA
jgi:hypothetical protein